MVKKFKIRSEVWLYPGETASWHFITVPKKQSDEIKQNFGMRARGWGSLPVQVTLGKTTWRTSIFPDKRSDSYLLPLKARARREEGVVHGDMVTFTLEIKG